MVASMELASASVTAPAPSRAAQYVRMSTEHQQYSPENQLKIIRQCAAAHNQALQQFAVGAVKAEQDLMADALAS